MSHEWGIEYGDMGTLWYACEGRWEHTDSCDAWADMNGSDCTCGLDPEPTDSDSRALAEGGS